MTGNNGWDYKSIKAAAKNKGITVPDLLALSPNNDPFYCGTASDWEKANWFMDVWNKAGFTEGVHLRRVHYRLVSDPDSKKYDGKPYENTDLDWSHLCEAGCKARYLGLIDPAKFVDRRNPDPIVRGGLDDSIEPEIEFDHNDWDSWTLPIIDTDLTGRLDLMIPEPTLNGFEYDSQFHQPYHLEVWVEKTTLEGDIWGVCDDLDITYLAGPGFQSVTRIVDLLKRVQSYGKPSVIFYISDFDPAGDVMPVAVARQMEFWAHKLEIRENIKLQPIVLTKRQVIDYRLPRTPIKESDLRKSGFEDRMGQGAVELDALEALYPGEIAKILREAAEPYRDANLRDRLKDAESEAEIDLDQQWDNKIGHYRSELDLLQDQADETISKFNERLQALSDELDQELSPIKTEIEIIRQAVQDEIYYFNPDLPERPTPEVNPPDDWIMFDSNRDYMDQIIAYKQHKGSA